MAGTASEVGRATLAGALTGILSALGGGTPAREATPVAPSISRPALVFGLPIATVALLAVGVFVLLKMAK